MIKVAPHAHVALGHHALNLVPAEDGHIAVFSSAGTGTLLTPDLTVLSKFSLPHQPLQAALSPGGSLLAVTASDGITFYSTAPLKNTFKKAHCSARSLGPFEEEEDRKSEDCGPFQRFNFLALAASITEKRRHLRRRWGERPNAFLGFSLRRCDPSHPL
jgi:hypothetical protein